MNVKLIFFLVFIASISNRALSFIGFHEANNYGFQYGNEDDPTQFRLLLKTTPFAIYDPENPSLRLTGELKLNPSIGILIGGGWIYTLYDRKMRNETDSKNIGGLATTEIRFYIPPKSYSNGVFFVGFRAAHLQSDLTKKLMFSPLSQIYGAPDSFFEPVRQIKKISSLQITGGLQFTVTDHIFLEIEAGIGTSRRYIKNDIPDSYGNPVFDRNNRATISNRNYDNWFTPFPYFQVHIGYGI